MAGRNRLPSNALKLQEIHLAGGTFSPHPALIEDPHRSLPVHRGPLPLAAPPGRRPHPALIQERIVLQNREIQSLLLDNQRLAATHVALKQELAVAQQEIRHISVAASNVKGDRDAQVREVYDRSLKMEAEVRSFDSLNTELAHVRTDVQKLSAARLELTSQLQSINNDLARARAELQQAPAIKTEIETMHQELQRGRAAVEYEKKVHASNLEQSQAMEKNMVSMARELEKLRAELANAEKRARAAAAAANPSSGYAVNYGNSNMVYGGNPYADTYGMHQAQGGAESGYQHGAATGSHGPPYDMQRAHVHR